MIAPASAIIDPNTNQPFERDTLDAWGYDAVNRWNETDHNKFSTSQNAQSIDTPFVRQRLRDAARNEYRNNSYCRGVTLRMANEVVGTAPTLEIEPLKVTQASLKAAQKLEDRWSEYCSEIDFRGKLFAAVLEEVIGGETFCMFRNNAEISTVQVDWLNYEADQFQTPYYETITQGSRNSEFPVIDGIKFDRLGNIVEYHKLPYHPGGNHVSSMISGDYDSIPPDVICHLWRQERPSQTRGVSHLAPCIELFGKLRRYTEAVIGTAENAASILGTLETSQDPSVCAPASPTPVQVPIGSGLFITAPGGWKANPFRSEQPTTTYGEFKKEILHEVFNCLLLPWNVASGDSSEYNFASGRLDYLIFYHIVDIVRKDLERKLLNRFFDFWMQFATFTPGIVPSGLGAFKHRWFWDKREAIDPVKAAKSAQTLKDAGLLDEKQYWQDNGLNPLDAIDQSIRLEMTRKKRRQEIADEMGVSLEDEKPEPKPQLKENELENA